MSEHKMKIALSQLKPLVGGEHFDVLETIILEHGLDFIIGNEFIDFCRRKKEPRIVVFVSTLAMHNASQPARPELLETCYSSILQKEIRLKNERNGVTHILRNTLQSIIDGADISKDKKNFPKLSGSDNDWHLAFELCLDHHQESNAFKLIHKRLEKGNNPELVLLCARSLVERSIDVNESDPIDWDNWIECQKIIHQELIKYKIANVPSKMAMLIAQYHSFIHEHDASIEWYKRAKDDHVLATYQIAQAYGNKKDFKTALSHLDQFLLKMCDQTYEFIDKNFKNADSTGKKYEGLEFNSHAATKALTDLQTTLDEVNTKAFLVSGTLLGYARQKSFLSHDKDIDVGIFEADNIFDVINTLMLSGKFSVKKGYFNIERMYQMPVVHLATGFAIDIFIYHQDGDGLITGVQSNFGYTQNFRFSQFELQEIEFINTRFYAPADIDKNLTENFGDWKTPDANFISHLQCPTTVDVGGEVYMMVCRLEMVRSIVEGKKVKMDRIVKILREHAAAEQAMTPELIDRLEGRYGMVSSAERQPIEVPVDRLAVLRDMKPWAQPESTNA
jgi:tetratricopeptide (TPR) repeat protein